MKFLIKGKLYNPIPFGQEESDWGHGSCGDCGCKENELHISGCDIERCPCCGYQLISCNCGVILEIHEEDENNLEYFVKLQKKEQIKHDKEIARILKALKEKDDIEM